MYIPPGQQWPRSERTRLWNYVELFWNSLNNAPLSIVFYLEMKVEVGVHDIGSRPTPRQGRNVGNPTRVEPHEAVSA